MEKISKEFKGKEEIHVVFDPEDINCLLSLFTFSKNSIREIPPWDNKDQKETYAKTIEWMEGLVKTTRSKI